MVSAAWWDVPADLLPDLDDVDAENSRGKYWTWAIGFLTQLDASLRLAAVSEPGPWKTSAWQTWWPDGMVPYVKAHAHILRQGLLWWQLRADVEPVQLLEDVLTVLSDRRPPLSF